MHNIAKNDTKVINYNKSENEAKELLRQLDALPGDSLNAAENAQAEKADAKENKKKKHNRALSLCKTYHKIDISYEIRLSCRCYVTEFIIYYFF